MSKLMEALEWLGDMTAQIELEKSIVKTLWVNEDRLYLLDGDKSNWQVVRSKGVSAISNSAPFSHNFPVYHFEVLSSMTPPDCACEQYSDVMLSSTEFHRLRLLDHRKYPKYIGTFVSPEYRNYFISEPVPA